MIRTESAGGRQRRHGCLSLRRVARTSFARGRSQPRPCASSYSGLLPPSFWLRIRTGAQPLLDFESKLATTGTGTSRTVPTAGSVCRAVRVFVVWLTRVERVDTNAWIRSRLHDDIVAFSFDTATQGQVALQSDDRPSSYLRFMAASLHLVDPSKPRNQELPLDVSGKYNSTAFTSSRIASLGCTYGCSTRPDGRTVCPPQGN